MVVSHQIKKLFQFYLLSQTLEILRSSYSSLQFVWSSL